MSHLARRTFERERVFATSLQILYRNFSTLHSLLISFDLVLLTVKSYDTKNLLEHYVQTFDTSTVVVSLQNGLGNIEIIEKLLGRKKTIGGRVIFGSELIEPGRVKVTVYADKVVLGSLPDGVSMKKVQEICKLFDVSGIPTTYTEEIEKHIWGKVLYNATLNPLSCLLEVNYGKLLENTESKRIMEEIINEIFLLLKKSKSTVFCQDGNEYRDHLFNQLIPLLANIFPLCFRIYAKVKRLKLTPLTAALFPVLTN